jgi:uncharacterized protein (TIGR03435 family)
MKLSAPIGIAILVPCGSFGQTADRSSTEDQVRLMLQQVLIDRFKLATHRETREFRSYALLVARTGSRTKLPPRSGKSLPCRIIWGVRPA